MKKTTYRIEDAIFERFPDYQRGVVIARKIQNGASPEAVIEMLRQTEADLRQRFAGQDAAANPRLHAWREAFRQSGIKPSEFRPSIEALVRRVVKGDALPRINVLADLCNLISLRHLIPVGGHDIDHLQEDLSLRLASGKETFIPFGSEQKEHPQPSEIIFTEGETVLTRRWVWRQGSHTLLLPETSAVEINLDGLPPVPAAEIETACAQTAAWVTTYCGGLAAWQILDRHHPEMSWEL